MKKELLPVPPPYPTVKELNKLMKSKTFRECRGIAFFKFVYQVRERYRWEHRSSMTVNTKSNFYTSTSGQLVQSATPVNGTKMIEIPGDDPPFFKDLFQTTKDLPND